MYVKFTNELELKEWAVVVVKWSAWSPFAPTIQVRIPRAPTIFLQKFFVWKTRKKQKRGRAAHCKN